MNMAVNIERQLVEVPVANLREGMFVARLDRPWLETPFVFQGFYIRGKDEIRELAQYCAHVYVDFEKARDGRGAQGLKRRSALVRAVQAPLRLVRRWRKAPEPDSGPGRYRDAHEMKAEMKAAEDVHTVAAQVVANTMEKVRNGGKLESAALTEVVNPMVDSVLRNKDALAALARLRRTDDYIYSHSISSSVWALVLGRHLGLDRSDLEQLGLAALLLDVGKTKLPKDMLTRPGPLSPEEMDLVKRHVDFGLEIASDCSDVTDPILRAIESHHERHDGSGYGKGLKGNRIPVFARICGVVDCYDAMISQRPYADPMSSYEAMRRLSDLADVHFQAELIEQFMQAVGMFPTGSLVELSSGEVAVVVAQNRTRRLRPKVMLVLDAEKRRRNTFPVVDLYAINEEKDDTTLWIARGLEPGAHGVNPEQFYL